MCEFPLSHVSAPLFKKSPYVAPPLQLQATAQISTHSTSPKGKKSFSVRTGYSLSMPLTVLGARISLLDAPIWCCNYECAASCVRAAWVSQTPCILSSLSWLGLGVPCVGLETPAPGGVGATKLRCLSSVLFFASSTSGRVFPLHLIKSLTRWYIGTPWLQKFLSAKILLIVQVTYQKISGKSVLGAWASGFSFYLLGCHLFPNPRGDFKKAFLKPNSFDMLFLLFSSIFIL